MTEPEQQRWDAAEVRIVMSSEFKLLCEKLYIFKSAKKQRRVVRAIIAARKWNKRRTTVIRGGLHLLVRPMSKGIVWVTPTHEQEVIYDFKAGADNMFVGPGRNHTHGNVAIFRL